jgi:hypothetical protein
METFKVAGVSKQNGVVKARFARDLNRVKVLQRAGHTDIGLIELPTALTKIEAAKYLLANNFDRGDAEIQRALSHVVPGAKLSGRTVKIKVPPKSMVELVGAKVEVEEVLTAKEAAKIRAEFNCRVKEAYEAN